MPPLHVVATLHIGVLYLKVLGEGCVELVVDQHDLIDQHLLRKFDHLLAHASPGADVAWGEPSPSADVAGVSPVPVQKWQG